jgi:integron integrase
MAIREASLLGQYPTPPADGDRRVPGGCRETGAPDPPKPRLLDRVRQAIGTRHYSRRTEKAYLHWIKRYIFFHGKRHPAEMGAAEVTAFLPSLAVQGKVAASTQNQALSALLFLYREVLGVELPWLDDVVRAKRPVHLPVVLTREEVRAVLQRLDGVPRLMAVLLYGAGLRLLECCRLRVKDVDFATNQITIRDGKGHKDRATMLPASVKADLSAHLERMRRQHESDLRHGAGWVELPGALLRKYPNAGRTWGWQWVFPATRFYADRVTGQRRRHHLHESVLQRAVKDAVRSGGGCQARHVPYLPALVCHAPPGGEPRHSHRPGAAGPPGRQHHDDLHARSQPGPRWGPEPRRSDVPMMGLRHREYHPLGNGQISRDVSPYIMAHVPGGVLQRGGNSSVQRAMSERFTWIYRTTQFDNAVQDTER